MTAAFPTGTILGYPRIGRRRELKFAVEAFWKAQIDQEELERRAAGLRSATRRRLCDLGLVEPYAIVDSFSYYDQVLDTAIAVGAVPTRFADVASPDGSVGLAGYFTIARGEGERLPVEMTKWFDSNYHYSVPEIDPSTNFRLLDRSLIDRFAEGKADGLLVRPAIVGPVTFLLLSKPGEGAAADFRPLDRIADLVPVYLQLLGELRAAGAEWVQLDEPALVSENTEYDQSEIVAAVRLAYEAIGAATTRPSVFVAAPYGQLRSALQPLAESAVEAIGFDLVRGRVPVVATPELAAALAAKTLVGGVLDGHNVWREDLAAAFAKLVELGKVSASVSVAPSTSLLHLPHDVTDEPELDPRIASWLAFADQKVAQVATLARGLSNGADAIAADFEAARAVLADRQAAAGVHVPAVRTRVADLKPEDRSRANYQSRVAAQDARLPLPPLPTTTIGSFPQTPEIRRARSRLTKGEIDQTEYEGFLRTEIESVVRLQERIGLDVLVHGEPERNDMVQYFAELLDGFVVTQNGWVQSYGSRATRPSILWGDVQRPRPMTVDWAVFAQSLTDRPVKGMLTGPVTILAWSFVRDDQPLKETADQVALALRDEIDDLQNAGIRIIQVDEPALRELLPLSKADQADYLAWSVGSFRLATGGARPETQIHTHLCYSEFGVVIDAIRELDADVTSIEAARSKMEVVSDIRDSGFDHGVGPGVYDIHSPRVPAQAEILSLLRTAIGSIRAERLWVNPDCGLKTRGYEETVASLTNLVAATAAARAELR